MRNRIPTIAINAEFTIFQKMGAEGIEPPSPGLSVPLRKPVSERT